jgi:hypothetical protein
MTNPALRVLPAFAWHVSHLLSFQHDGRGLPRLGSPLLWVLAALKLVLACLVALYLCASVTRRFYAFSGYLLLWSGVDVGLLGLSLAVDRVPDAFISTCYAWGLIAFIALLYRAASQHEKNTS